MEIIKQKNKKQKTKRETKKTHKNNCLNFRKDKTPVLNNYKLSIIQKQ